MSSFRLAYARPYGKGAWGGVKLDGGLHMMPLPIDRMMQAARCALGGLTLAMLAPAALGLVTLVFGLGQALGPYLAGFIADTTASFSPAFLLSGATALLVGGGGSLALRRSRRSLHASPQRAANAGDR